MQFTLRINMKLDTHIISHQIWMKKWFERKNRLENYAELGSFWFLVNFHSSHSQINSDVHRKEKWTHLDYGNCSKTSSPYTKNEQDERRNKVYSMYFEKGFSAIKIAIELKVNRNTINQDVKFLCSELIQKDQIKPAIGC